MQINFDLKNAELHLTKNKISNLKTKLWKNLNLNEKEIIDFYEKNEKVLNFTINNKNLKEDYLKEMIDKIRKMIFFKMKDMIYYPMIFYPYKNELNLSINKEKELLIKKIFNDLSLKDEIIDNDNIKLKIEKLKKIKKIQKDLLA